MIQVLIVKTGEVHPKVRLGLGDYDRWFVRTLGGRGRRYQVLPAHLGAPLPGRARRWDAIIVTGSPSSVSEQAGWMRRWGQWLLEAAGQRVPVLGVCFGHQLLAWAHGATVSRNPRGREIGTIGLKLTPRGKEDPLFEGIPGRFFAQATHEDVALGLPPGLELLAGNENTQNQAFALGPFVRAVQFHPEIDAAVMGAVIGARREGLWAEAVLRGEDPAQRLRALSAGIRPTPCGPRILENFLRHFT